MRVILGLLLLVGIAFSAPSPPARAFQIRPGWYDMVWDGHKHRAYFTESGHEETISVPHGSTWRGTWTCKRGILTVTEAALDNHGNAGSLRVWVAELNDRGEGRAEYTESKRSLTITMRRSR